MSISTALNNALTGLSASSRLTETASNNIANALTPGFATKSLQVTSAVLAGKGTGVRLGEVERAYALDVTTARREADGALGYASARSDAMSGVAQALGDGDDVSSLFARYAGFDTALLQLSDAPESVARQTAAVDAARALVNKFGTVADETARLRQQAENGIASTVSRINTALSDMGDLNADIVAFRASGRDAPSE